MNILKLFPTLFLETIMLLSLSACISMLSTNEYGIGALKEVQKAVSFTIILPKYLPVELRPAKPNFNVHMENEDNTVSNWVTIGYFLENSNNIILIDERYITYNTHPSDESEIFFIDGIRILEKAHNKVIISDKTPINLISLLYIWNHNGIQFTIQSDGYSKDECRKIVESLVK